MPRLPDRRQPTRQLVRMALCLAERLRSPQHFPPPIDLPVRAWQGCCRLTRMYEQAQTRGWSLAAGRLRQRLKGQFQDLIAALAKALDAPEPSALPVTPRDLYAELLSLHDEFGEVRCDRAPARSPSSRSRSCWRGSAWAASASNWSPTAAGSAGTRSRRPNPTPPTAMKG